MPSGICSTNNSGPVKKNTQCIKKDYTERNIYKLIRPTAKGLFLVDTTVGGWLLVKTTSQFNSTVDLSGTVNSHTRLDVSGLAYIHAQIDVSGRTGATNGKINAVDIGYDLSGKGAFTDLSAIDMSANNIVAFKKVKAPLLEVDEIKYIYQNIVQNDGDMDISGNVDISDNLDVSGTTILHNTLKVGSSNNVSDGTNGAAIGTGNTASATDAFAMGSYTTASQDRSVAMGQGTAAGQANSLAIGQYNDLSDNNVAFVIGKGTADNARSDAFIVNFAGDAILAKDLSALTIGYNTDASGKGAFTDLSATDFSTNTLFAIDLSANNLDVLNTLDVSGTANIHAQLDISGRTGATNGKINSVDIGYDLSGKGAFTDLSATDLVSTNVNVLNTLDVSGAAILHTTLKVGATTTASGTNAVAMGYGNTASGNNAVAMGKYSDALGNNSVAMGQSTTASQSQAVAMGQSTIASQINAVAMGKTTVASGNEAVAMGEQSTAYGNHSVAMGEYSDASGNNSVVMGKSTLASGTETVAMGQNTIASGVRSVAMGKTSKSKGEESLAVGEGTISKHPASLAIGKYNVEPSAGTTTARNNTDIVFVIGNGTGNGARSDAFNVSHEGNAILAKDLSALTIGYNTDASGKGAFTDLSATNMLATYIVASKKITAPTLEVETIKYVYQNVTQNDSDMDISGNLDVSENLDVSSATVLHDTLDVSGKTVLHDTLTLNGDIEANTYNIKNVTEYLGDAIKLEGMGKMTYLVAGPPADVNSVTDSNIGVYSVKVIGKSNFVGNVDISGASSVLDVSGAANIRAQLDISGRTGATNGKINAVDIGYDLSGKGAFTDLSAQNAHIFGDLKVDGSIIGTTGTTGTTYVTIDKRRIYLGSNNGAADNYAKETLTSGSTKHLFAPNPWVIAGGDTVDWSEFDGENVEFRGSAADKRYIEVGGLPSGAVVDFTGIRDFTTDPTTTDDVNANGIIVAGATTVAGLHPKVTTDTDLTNVIGLSNIKGLTVTGTMKVGENVNSIKMKASDLSDIKVELHTNIDTLNLDIVYQTAAEITTIKNYLYGQADNSGLKLAKLSIKNVIDFPGEVSSGDMTKLTEILGKGEKTDRGNDFESTQSIQNNVCVEYSEIKSSPVDGYIVAGASGINLVICNIEEAVNFNSIDTNGNSLESKFKNLTLADFNTVKFEFKNGDYFKNSSNVDSAHTYYIIAGTVDLNDALGSGAGQKNIASDKIITNGTKLGSTGNFGITNFKTTRALATTQRGNPNNRFATSSTTLVITDATVADMTDVITEKQGNVTAIQMEGTDITGSEVQLTDPAVTYITNNTTIKATGDIGGQDMTDLLTEVDGTKVTALEFVGTNVTGTGDQLSNSKVTFANNSTITQTDAVTEAHLAAHVADTKIQTITLNNTTVVGKGGDLFSGKVTFANNSTITQTDAVTEAHLAAHVADGNILTITLNNVTVEGKGGDLISGKVTFANNSNITQTDAVTEAHLAAHVADGNISTITLNHATVEGKVNDLKSSKLTINNNPAITITDEVNLTDFTTIEAKTTGDMTATVTGTITNLISTTEFADDDTITVKPSGGTGYTVTNVIELGKKSSIDSINLQPTVTIGATEDALIFTGGTGSGNTTFVTGVDTALNKYTDLTLNNSNNVLTGNGAGTQVKAILDIDGSDNITIV